MRIFKRKISWFNKDNKTMSNQSLELQLRQSQESLEFALQSAQMGTWDINLGSKTISCSKEMLDLWGVSPKEFCEERSILQSKVHSADIQKMNTAINSAINNRTIYELEYRIMPSPGVERWVMSRGRCAFDSDSDSDEPVRFSGVVYDVTEKKRKEEVLEAAIKTRDQFLMMAGHELKTPLTCLNLDIQVKEWDLKHKYPEAFSASQIKRGLKKQQDNILKITRIIDNILDESKIAEGHLHLQLERFNLCKVVKDVLESVKTDLEIEFHSSAKNITVKWDRFRIEQVIFNLLINAIKYSKKKPIQIELMKNDTLVMIIVRDQGVGIKHVDQKRIFERFGRGISENEVTGMGLGLYLSDKIVQMHGGKIELKSELGIGSEFTVFLPVK
jgi:two-component system sensor histidine kinase VicK